VRRVPVAGTRGSPAGALRGWYAPRDLRKLRWLAVPLLLLMLLLWRPHVPGFDTGSSSAAPSAARASGSAPVAPPLPVAVPPCPPGIEPRLLLLVEDDSDSVAGDRRRYPESRQFVEWISRSAYCHEQDRAAVIHFASTTTASGPFLLRSEAGRISDALMGPDRGLGTGTELSPAVEAAAELAERFPSHAATLVLNTDGDISDDDVAFPRLAAFPGEIHVVAIGGPLPPTWGAVRTASDRVLTNSTQDGEVARGLADIWLQATGR
jgi:hypothetical protein